MDALAGGAKIVVVAGPPGAGKTTAARLLAARLPALACVIESDFWWTTIVNGFVPPWQPAAYEQNRTVVRSFSRAAAALAEGGYAVVLEGVIGPWNLDLVETEAAAVGAAVHYAVLRPSLDVALRRATGREGQERIAGHPALTDEAPIRKLWNQFADLAGLEPHVIDNSQEDPAQTVESLWSLLRSGRLLI